MGAVIPYLHAVLRGKIGTYEGRCNIKDGMDDKVKKKVEECENMDQKLIVKEGKN